MAAIVVTAVLAGAFVCGTARAEMKPVSYADSSGRTAFKAVKPGSERLVSVREIEAIGLKELVTRSPWESGDHRYAGVLLRDVLTYLEMDDAVRVAIVATDNYVQVIPREDWTKWPVLLATRESDALLARRSKGPTRVVYPISSHPELDSAVYKGRWIWLIESISAEYK
ncbi:MAG: hypothetical protein C0606_06705 [Hyphomicrobiales bacterium]|nr:MAG: hypothetical protein C0606_06705 [Hyphomicrobiales bacterium]